MPMKALVVVAHPDDHVLWAGGTILKLKTWEWHVISLCNSHNDDFTSKLKVFKSSCQALGVKRFLARELKDYQPRELMEVEQPLKIQKEILAFADKEYDLVFTHSVNPHCEYGFHANHSEVRDSVNHLLGNNLLTSRGTLYFCYKPLGNNQPVVVDLDSANYKVDLSRQELDKKRQLKTSFHWAEGDLKGLGLWDNDEPEVEAFAANGHVVLPVDFIKL